MKKRKNYLRFLPGTVLSLWAVFALLWMPGFTQYAFEPEGTPQETVKVLADSELTGVSLLGVSYGQSVGSVSGVTVFAAGEGYFDLCPLGITEGCGLSSLCLKNGAAYCVADENLAFQLFGAADPIGKTVSYAGKDYILCGTAKFTRTAGDTDGYALWIPLSSTETKPQLMTAVAEEVTESKLESVFSGGSYWDLSKEKLRYAILPGAVAFLLLLALLKEGIRTYQKQLSGYAARVKENAGKYYGGQTLLRALPEGALLLLEAAAGIGLCALLLKLFISPVYVFTEWVPENLVSAASILTRVRENCAAAAKPVKYITREVACLRVYGGMLRWGTVLLLTATAVNALKNRRKTK